MAMKIETRTLGNCFATLYEELEKKMTVSKNLSELEAGEQISLALANMEAVYVSALPQQIDAVDPEALAKLEIIERLMINLKNSVGLSAVAIQVEGLIKSLPFNGIPQLNRIRARLTRLDGEHCQVMIKCEGNFPFFPNPADNRYRASVTFNNGEIRLAGEARSNCLKFVDTHRTNSDTYSSLPFNLKIPRETGVMRWLPVNSSYLVWATLPPLKIGELTAHYISEELEGNERQQCSTRVFHLRGHPDNPCWWVEQSHDIFPESGSAIVPSSIRVQIQEGASGIYKILFTRLTAARIEFTVGIAAEEGRSCRLDFSVHYTVLKGTVKETASHGQIPLYWGDAKILSVEPNKRLQKVVLETLDEARYTFYRGVTTSARWGFFSRGEARNPYVRVMQKQTNELHIDTV